MRVSRAAECDIFDRNSEQSIQHHHSGQHRAAEARHAAGAGGSNALAFISQPQIARSPRAFRALRAPISRTQ
jgi:hypothetical protein